MRLSAAPGMAQRLTSLVTGLVLAPLALFTGFALAMTGPWGWLPFLVAGVLTGLIGSWAFLGALVGLVAVFANSGFGGGAAAMAVLAIGAAGGWGIRWRFRARGGSSAPGARTVDQVERSAA